jgi:cytochrome c peroxidase
VACTSCHLLEKGGGDGLVRSIGANGEPLAFNTPTVFNADLSFRFNWRGNFRTLQEQNEAVLRDATLMDTTWEELLPKLRSDPRYAGDFTAIYGSAPERETVLDALVTFQRSLHTPDSRFDRYLNGERNAISVDEEQGYLLFKANGCVACHQGVNIGGNLFQKFGIFSNPFAGQKVLTQADLGRFAITGVESDRHVFRVPSLRNVAVTAPYFHDGRTSSIEAAVRIMAQNQLGRELDKRDVDLIAKFLRTLTGEYRGQLLTGDSGRSSQ